MKGSNTRLQKTAISAAVLCGLLFASPAKVMSPEDTRLWREDLHFMAREMEATHKNLYHAISREQFATMVEALDAKIPSLERHEVIVAMAEIVAAVGDGHTNIYPARDKKIGFHTLPVSLTFFGEDLYIRAAHESERSLVGEKVVGIGDLNIKDAYAAVKKMIGHENEQGVRYWAQYLLRMPEVLHALHIVGTPDEVPLTLADGTGTRRVVLRSFAPVEIITGDVATLFNHGPGWIDARDLFGSSEAVWLRGNGDAFHYEHIGNLLYVQINAITDKPDETLAHFAQRLHDEIAATRPNKVAIDLRLNRGGDATLITPIIRSLIQSESIDRPGRLFAIIGPATFSAAQMFADALERYTKVTFVGEPSGSKGNAYGDSRQIFLPHSGITVRASIYYWQDWHPLDKRDAIVPQVSAPLTFDDYRKNIDPALVAIQQYPASAKDSR